MLKRIAREIQRSCAHGIVCKVLLLNLLPGRSPADWHSVGPVYNAAITELARGDSGWELVRLNEVPPEVVRVTPQ